MSAVVALAVMAMMGSVSKRGRAQERAAQAIHDRHLHVHQHSGVGVVGCAGQLHSRFSAPLRAPFHLEATGFQQTLGDLQVHLVVVHHQHTRSLRSGPRPRLGDPGVFQSPRAPRALAGRVAGAP